jgi:hypothetical protein
MRPCRHSPGLFSNGAVAYDYLSISWCFRKSVKPIHRLGRLRRNDLTGNRFGVFANEVV